MTLRGYWITWTIGALAGTAYLASALTRDNQTMFVPGEMTAGHHQIELKCATCHTPFQGVTDGACEKCHAEELSAANDSHPKSKFTDPRNAERLKLLDARSCIACHREHNPALTRQMGVTLPDDFCVLCHSDVGSDRPSHAGMTFDTCASAGCHNFHDNTALYEDFLIKHAYEPPVLPWPFVPARAMRRHPSAGEARSAALLSSKQQDAPAHVTPDGELVAAWESTAHARAGVNCTGCHRSPAAPAIRWLNEPGTSACTACHERENKGFLEGRHGMRIASGLAPMSPRLARLPMKPQAADLELTCSSCHSSHRFDTRRAALDACLGCHDDRHSLAYLKSPHYALWKSETEAGGQAGSGVSCATCHLPRERRKEDGIEAVFVQHNQNHNLRPNEKMARGVCLSCHGLEFTLDALADAELIEKNFTGRPSRRVKSVEMANRRVTKTTN